MDFTETCSLQDANGINDPIDDGVSADHVGKGASQGRCHQDGIEVLLGLRTWGDVRRPVGRIRRTVRKKWKWNNLKTLELVC
jgi:hypothetical protein